MTEENEELSSLKAEIVDTYLKIVEDKQSLPTYADFLAQDISRSKIKHHFGNIESLHIYIEQNHNATLTTHISTQSSLFKTAVEISKKLTHKRFIITTAVAGKAADKNFLKACDIYCSVNNAQMLILPCEDVTNSFDNKTAIFDAIFNDPKYTMISDDVYLNNNLLIRGVQVSAKQIKPTTGLLRIGKRDGSYIFAAPKQFLEYTAAGNDKYKSYAVMTPGACTVNNYQSKADLKLSKRTQYIAEQDHTIGGIIVELVDDQYFHFRHFQADDNGNFKDLGIEYRTDGTTLKVPVYLSIELHNGKHDIDLFNSFVFFTLGLDIRRIFVHDCFDGTTVNHHSQNDIVSKVLKQEEDVKYTLEDELIDLNFMLNYLAKFCKDELSIVKSNHDEWLKRYLKEGRYIHDPENHRFALKIADFIFQKDKDVLEEAMYISIPEGNTRNPKIKFYQRSDSFLLGDTEMLSHGDLGLNGGPASLNGLEKIYGNCVVGHCHSAAIQRGVRRIGTMTRLNLGYNVGPSSWTQGFGITYEDGTGQLINYIDGELHV